MFACIVVLEPCDNQVLKIKYNRYTMKQEERVGIPSTGWTPPYSCVSPKPGREFPTAYVLVFISFLRSVSKGGK